MTVLSAFGWSEMPLLGTGETDYTSARRIAMEMLGLDAAA
jgi:hypothetical protein